MDKGNFLEYVQKGREGKNKGLVNSFDVFNEYLNNTQKGTYYAVGGSPAAGKTGFADDNFILTPYDHYYNEVKKNGGKISIRWFYYSFEISYMAKRAKWTAYKLFNEFELKVDSAAILSKGKNHCSDELYTKVVAVDQYMDELFDHICFVQDGENPTGIRNTILKYANANGKVLTEKYVTTDGIAGERRVGYQANNLEEHVLILLDHVALCKKERGYDTKQNIDKI